MDRWQLAVVERAAAHGGIRVCLNAARDYDRLWLDERARAQERGRHHFRRRLGIAARQKREQQERREQRAREEAAKWAHERANDSQAGRSRGARRKTAYSTPTAVRPGDDNDGDGERPDELAQ